MEIITWNIQVALGVDGRVDVSRIANTIKDIGASDVICLQEVTRQSKLSKSGSKKPGSNIEFYGLADELAEQFPDYEMFYVAAVDRPDAEGRYYFGNMILSKVPVDFMFSHKLPQPPDPTTRTMPRQALELFVRFDDAPLRIVTTHLEFFATGQRKAQLEYLIRYQKECCERHSKPSPSGTGSYVSPPETDRTIVCGDFNMEVGTDHYKYFTSQDSGFVDAWSSMHQGKPHPPTCGIYDLEQWPDGEHCRDFFFLSPSMTPFAAELTVNTETQASDHQPMKLKITT